MKIGRDTHAFVAALDETRLAAVVEYTNMQGRLDLFNLVDLRNAPTL